MGICERVGRLAEAAALGVSRRGFLGRLGQATLGVAALLALPQIARATSVSCCTYSCTGPGGMTATRKLCLGNGVACPTSVTADGNSCKLVSSKAMADCSECVTA